MRSIIRTGALTTLTVAAAMTMGTPLALADHDGGWGGYERGGVRAASYINPDTGAATENADVDRDSSCYSPTSATTSS